MGTFKVGDVVDLNERSRERNKHFPDGPFEVVGCDPSGVYINMKHSSGSEWSAALGEVELARPKFAVGDRASVVGNNTAGLRHYLDEGEEVTILEDRTAPTDRVGYQDVPSYFVEGSLHQDVHPADLEQLKDDLDCRATRKTRRAVLAKVLKRLDQDYAGVEPGDGLDGHKGLANLLTQLGRLADEVANGNMHNAHEELVTLTSDCLSWLEDAEEQDPGEDTL